LLDPIASWVDERAVRSGALIFEGPAGIGKTHAFAEVIDAAVSSGARVLRAQPVAAELHLVGSALIDLCMDVSDEQIAELPDVQARALSAALLRGGGAPAVPQAVALAVSTLLRMLSARQPVLIALDDLQWLDAHTAEVVGFALRRLPLAGVGVVATLRTGPGTEEPEFVRQLASALPLVRHVVPPLSAPELEQILRGHLGGEIPRWIVRSAVRGSAGNPLFALELARTLLARPDDVETFDSESLPLPASLLDVVGRHVAQLPEATRSALAAAAAIRHPSLRHLQTLGLSDDLVAAERSGIVRIRQRQIYFNHPMYAAVSYQQLSGVERIALHARIAGVVEGDEERARHLAVGAVEPDEDVAAALDLARRRAIERGALDAALEAAQLAVRATPAGSARAAQRRVEFASLMFRLGDGGPARRELNVALTEARQALDRARVLYTLAQVVNDTEGPVVATPLYLQALELATDDPELAADIRMGLAINYSDDWETALAHAREAVRLVGSVPSPAPARVARALVAEAGALFYTGGGADLDTCRRAVELQAGDSALPVSDRAISVLFYLQLWTDDFAGARATMDEAHKLALDEGDESSRCYVLGNRAKLEVRSGDWSEADRLIDECVAIAEMGENPVWAAIMGGERAWLAAYRGDLDTAVAVAEQDITNGERNGNRFAEQRGRGMRGWCALAAGDGERAALDLDRYMELFESNNAGEPALRLLAGDHVEALVLSNRLDDAEQALRQLVEPAERLGRTALLAAAARAESLLYAERGDADTAIAAAERSLALYDDIERRFERARTLLVAGQVHRRFRQRASARRFLDEALAEFVRLGAAGFAARTRIELARIGGRGASAVELTQTERQIAEHAARGMRSAEIGKIMFLSTKTVSANLTRIYQKLGIRNRAELAARLPAPPD